MHSKAMHRFVITQKRTKHVNVIVVEVNPKCSISEIRMFKLPAAIPIGLVQIIAKFRVRFAFDIVIAFDSLIHTKFSIAFICNALQNIIQLNDKYS